MSKKVVFWAVVLLSLVTLNIILPSANAVWYDSYGACRNITITESAGYDRINEPVVNSSTLNWSPNVFTGIWVNTSGDYAILNCSEIRMTTQGCDEAGTELEFNITYASAPNCKVLFEANVSASSQTVYSVYYNKTGYTEPSWLPDVNLRGSGTSLNNSLVKIYYLGVDDMNDIMIEFNDTGTFSGMANIIGTAVGYGTDSSGVSANFNCNNIKCTMNSHWTHSSGYNSTHNLTLFANNPYLYDNFGGGSWNGDPSYRYNDSVGWKANQSYEKSDGTIIHTYSSNSDLSTVIKWIALYNSSHPSLCYVFNDSAGIMTTSYAQSHGITYTPYAFLEQYNAHQGQKGEDYGIVYVYNNNSWVDCYNLRKKFESPISAAVGSEQLFEEPTTTTTTPATTTTTPILICSIDTPENNSVFSQYQNWNFNGTIYCSGGGCGDVQGWAKYESVSLWSESSYSDFNDGLFSYTVNNTDSGDLLLMGDVYEWYGNTSANPVMDHSTATGSSGNQVYGVSGTFNGTDFVFNYGFGMLGAFMYQSENISRATSSNFWTWTNYAGNPTLYPLFTDKMNRSNDAGVLFPFNNTYWELVYECYNSTEYPAVYNSVCLANSTNQGKTWVKYENNPVIIPTSWYNWEIYLGAGWINRTDNIRHLFFTGSYLPNFNDIGYANSTDGKAWNVLNNPIINHSACAGSPTPTEIISNSFFTHKGHNWLITGELGGGNGNDLFIWESNNFFTWFNETRLINHSTGSWDNLYIGQTGSSVIVKNNDQYFCTVGVQSVSNDFAIGCFKMNYTSGWYESSVKDITKQALINCLDWDSSTPTNTNIKVQIGYSNDSAAWIWSGNYSNPSCPNNNTAQYIKYRVWLTGNNTNYPSLNSISINYTTTFMDQTTTALRTSNNPFSCGVLNAGNSCLVSWNVNGTVLDDYNIYIYANSTLANNQSLYNNVTITEEPTTTTTTTTTTPATTTLTGIYENNTFAEPNITNFRGFFDYGNSVTGSMFVNLVLMALWVIIFISLKGYDFPKAFAGASFICFIISVPFVITQLANEYITIIFLLASAFSVIILKKSG